MLICSFKNLKNWKKIVSFSSRTLTKLLKKQVNIVQLWKCFNENSQPLFYLYPNARCQMWSFSLLFDDAKKQQFFSFLLLLIFLLQFLFKFSNKSQKFSVFFRWFNSLLSNLFFTRNTLALEIQLELVKSPQQQFKRRRRNEIQGPFCGCFPFLCMSTRWDLILNCMIVAEKMLWQNGELWLHSNFHPSRFTQPKNSSWCDLFLFFYMCEVWQPPYCGVFCAEIASYSFSTCSLVCAAFLLCLSFISFSSPISIHPTHNLPRCCSQICACAVSLRVHMVSWRSCTKRCACVSAHLWLVECVTEMGGAKKLLFGTV